MEPKELIVTDQAYADLDDIFDFIAADSVDEARRFTSELIDHLLRIAETGHAGVPRDSIRPGLRLAVYGRYNIYFRVLSGETIILHIVHSARDIGRLSFDLDPIR
ncbi:MAG: type II toxin-antitoxin system RelE/ParE family toxin [Alphaproteobacteria bacterium]|nr:type II toxin-antitoxin system RelE/ParE family toxin [Alphaproteobacteria bacterium]